VRRKYSKPLYLLLAMVGLILAIACANTANLLLARATARQREIAVRLSIGAGRFRLFRQLLTESLVLSVMSGALGILVAIAGTRLLTVLLANSGDGFVLNADLNWRVLAITIALSVLCGVLFGLAPALQSTRPALVPALKDMTRLPRYRLRQILVVGQIALLMLLLTGAGLFVRTLSNLHSIPLGFNRDNLAIVRLGTEGNPEQLVLTAENVRHSRLPNPPPDADPRSLLVGLREPEADRPEPIEHLGRDVTRPSHGRDASAHV
jgi:hypothetical protein